MQIKETIEKGVAEGLLPIFVYGTLLSGFRNHDHYLRGKVPVATAKIHAKMLSLGAFPGIYDLDETGLTVVGEIYLINDRELRAIDRLEGYHENYPLENLYNRRETTATIDNENSTVTVQTYVFNTKQTNRYPQILNGSWREYTAIASFQNQMD